MYEGNPLHIWTTDSVVDRDEDHPLARLTDLVDHTDPAFHRIVKVLMRFREAGIELTAEAVEIATKLGRLDHEYWGASDGPAYKAAPTPYQASHPPVVYYVRRGALVKIGTTTNLWRRMVSLLPEQVLATEPGGIGVEADRHRQFAALRVEGQREWFRAGAILQAHVERVRSLHGAPDPTLPTLPIA
ncbi:GIY-YIG nuclease family protein [Streptomyces sp. ME03-5709C]|nr:GIY-YIG nuclease family protein [Streptomyces sp. ME03-5709C]